MTMVLILSGILMAGEDMGFAEALKTIQTKTIPELRVFWDEQDFPFKFGSSNRTIDG